ncbi:MAG: SDR family oxidoreductase [Chloroflexi bacterium]|nr:SDR family oxidoreductase [Chloroflexota bacterium]
MDGPLGTVGERLSAMQSFRLDGRVAFITGAGSENGIGRATALAFASAGGAVGLVDVDDAGVQANVRAVRAAGVTAFGTTADVTDAEAVGHAVAAVEQALGPIDILVNAAGITRATPIWETPLAEFDLVLNVNVRGGYLCLRAVLPGMMQRRRGRIVWISSVAGKQGGGVFGSTSYATSKAAVIGLCQGAARELGPYGITSNAIAPGMVLTGLLAKSGSPEIEEEIRQRVAATAPLRRAAEPEDVAAAALYLASDAASYVTGEILDVNGGAYFD